MVETFCVSFDFVSKMTSRLSTHELMAFFEYASDLEHASPFDDTAEGSSVTSVGLWAGEISSEKGTFKDSDDEVQEEHEKTVVSAR